jgi:hypothetical protein
LISHNEKPPSILPLNFWSTSWARLLLLQSLALFVSFPESISAQSPTWPGCFRESPQFAVIGNPAVFLFLLSSLKRVIIR